MLPVHMHDSLQRQHAQSCGFPAQVHSTMCLGHLCFQESAGLTFPQVSTYRKFGDNLGLLGTAPIWSGKFMALASWFGCIVTVAIRCAAASSRHYAHEGVLLLHWQCSPSEQHACSVLLPAQVQQVCDEVHCPIG
jgi:hypothetical protein